MSATGGRAGRFGKVVAVGGGHGLARALGALRTIGVAPTAIVTVADDGGSSGRLRRDYDIIAPGDLRRALLTLARNRGLADLLAHRFVGGELAGHALGNLLLLAAAEAEGDFLAALERVAALLDCGGRVLPATLAPVTLRARVAGREVVGQRSISKAGGPIDRLQLDPPDPPVCVEALAEIARADAILLGPGSLYTSVIVNLLIPGLRAAIAATSVPLIAIANLRTQPGETDGLDAAGHVAALSDTLGGRRLDVLVTNVGGVRDDPGTVPLDPLTDGLARVGRVVPVDVVERDLAGAPTASHDRARLAAVLAQLLPTVRGVAGR